MFKKNWGVLVFQEGKKTKQVVRSRLGAIELAVPRIGNKDGHFDYNEAKRVRARWNTATGKILGGIAKEVLLEKMLLAAETDE